MLKRLREWFRINYRKGCACGGTFREVGESGFMVARIHETCNKCGEKRYWLVEH